MLATAVAVKRKDDLSLSLADTTCRRQVSQRLAKILNIRLIVITRVRREEKMATLSLSKLLHMAHSDRQKKVVAYCAQWLLSPLLIALIK